MQLIDTHTHIYCEEFDNDRDSVVQRALEAGVCHLIFPAIDDDSYSRQQAVADAYPQFISQMMGLHPTSVAADYQQRLLKAEEILFANPNHYVAVGEIGLDFYWDRTFEKEQVEALRQQLLWAKQLDKPVSLHCREANAEMLAILSEPQYHGLRGVFHCFSGTLEQALQAVRMGFCIGIGGVATFKKSTLPEIISHIPLQSVLLETDSPYLAPVPHRGQRNESAYVKEVAQKVADIFSLPIDEIALQTTHNARLLFHL